MRPVVITPPAPVVTWEEADEHLKLSGDESQRAQVEAMIAAATGHIDGPDGWLGRCLGVQTLELPLMSFGTWINLPYPPIIDVESVKYFDGEAVWQTLDPADYEIYGRRIAPVASVTWPAVYSRRNSGVLPAIRVRYRAGYVADPAANPLVPALPAPIKAAILLMVGDLYANRETTVTGASGAAVSIPMSTTVQNLLSTYRVFS